MYARIHEDLINPPDDDTVNREGVRWGDGTVEGLLYIWRTLDDDRIPYYVGIGDDESLEVIFDWSQHDAGTTILQTMNLRTYVWEDVIG